MNTNREDENGYGIVLLSLDSEDIMYHGRNTNPMFKWAGWQRGWSSSPSRGKIHIIQTSYGAHPAYYPMGTGGSFPAGKAADVSS
jgi:hypothetical protein